MAAAAQAPKLKERKQGRDGVPGSSHPGRNDANRVLRFDSPRRPRQDASSLRTHRTAFERAQANGGLVDGGRMNGSLSDSIAPNSGLRNAMLQGAPAAEQTAPQEAAPPHLRFVQEFKARQQAQRLASGQKQVGGARRLTTSACSQASSLNCGAQAASKHVVPFIKRCGLVQDDQG